MKNTFLLLIAILSLSCDDPEIKDPAAGNWLYENTSIRASFTLIPSTHAYAVTNIAVTIDGINYDQFTGTAESVQKGIKVGKLIFTEGDHTITLFDCSKLVMHPAWAIGDVRYENGSVVTDFKGGGLKAN